ncbi:VOC family protein [Planctomonas psychrotolerans]|uniref:VOC family protein n=1 Tax=Planctomonas psychrotolerans TaxID=2528712 RepID=UPI00123BE94B|nr:VOC family protein [Planctomonas psychrotolerans]
MARGDVFPIINCRDLAEARRFYLTVFGAAETYRFPEDGEASYLVLGIGTGQVGLGDGTGPALYGDTPRPATGHAVDICLYVDDLAGVVDAARQYGAPIPVEPSAMPWGETIAYMQDPEGTMLLVIQDDADD